MPLSEKTIESAVEGLKKSPAEFQRLVEYYAYLTYPHRFKELVPQGRNPSGVAVKGWPDIYSLSDGLMDVVEATHSPAWSGHLEEDLEKAEALGKGRLSGFVFVAWANEPSPLTDHQKKNPLYEKLINYRDRLMALGIPPKNINFIFKKQLVRALAQPRFAGVLTGILDLPSHSTPFKTVSETKDLFGMAGRYDVFAPAREEYSKGLVHRAAITGEVEKRLQALGWAWLRGRGAAGKTVLAVHIGLGHESKSLPAYYLDLSKTDVSVSEALNVITTHADDGVLFIIDNVHLDQAFARDCFDHWQSVSGGSHLLLIGRDTTTTDFRGTALPLDDLREEALTLEVTQEDLEGVFLRLAGRALPPSGSVPQPPQDVLQRWHRLFGGDLIAFSAAVAQRLKSLAQNVWTIQAQDAAKYVQSAYLRKADEAERLNLLRLAVLAQLEMAVPEEALELAKIETFLQQGLVHFGGRGRNNRYGYYHLVHPGLGDLILTAAGYSDGELKQFISEQWGHVAYRNPFAGTLIAYRLESSNRVEEATLILKGIVELENGLEEILVTPGLQYLRTNSERLTRLGILSESDIDQKVAAINPKLYQSALRTPLHFLSSTLSYAALNLPAAHAALTAALERPENFNALSEAALRTPLHLLSSFLRYAARHLPAAHAALTAALGRPEGLEALTEVALRTPLGHLAPFLRYAARHLPAAHAALTAALERPEGLEALSEAALRTPLNDSAPFLEYAARHLPAAHAALTAALERPENFNALSEAALRTPLGDLATFLRYAARHLPAAHAALTAALGRPEGLEALTEVALRTPLGHLATFLGYAAQELPITSQALTNKLTEPVNINYLAEAACQTPSDSLLHFLQTVSFGSTVLLAIDKNKWNKCRLESGPEQLDSFPAVAKIFQHLGRPELAEAPALSLIRAADQQQWRSSSVGLHHLSHVMRLGRSAGEEVIHSFITSIVTPTWLAQQYDNAPPYGIAAALYSVWGYYEEEVLAHFRLEALKSRVRYGLNYFARMTPEDLSETLQLLGVSALIGVRVGKINVTWPNPDQVNDAILFRIPPAEAEAISNIMIQVWLGLRVMAGMRSDRLYIRPELGERVLALWKNSMGNTDKQNALNRWMINWMERCAQSGWTLIADQRKV